MYLDDDVVAQTGVKSRSLLAKGTFLGFYSGRLVPLKYLRARDSHIAMEIDGTDFAVVRASEEDIIGYINEPPPGQLANVMTRTLHLPCGNAVAYFAAEDIPKLTELWVHYGDFYDRDYEVGRKATISDDEMQVVRTPAPGTGGSDLLLRRFCAPRRIKRDIWTAIRRALGRAS